MEQKMFIARRSKYSEPEAIRLVANYGVARVIEVRNLDIVEEFINFEVVPLTIGELAGLAKDIHENKRESTSLVHGDLGKTNTTKYGNVPKCFDYEHAHFGNVYADLGRIVLRSCRSITDVKTFFDVYAGFLPSVNDFKKGLIYFCEWQHKLRGEKGLAFQNIPLRRKEQLERSGNSLEEVLNTFKNV